MIAAQTHSQQLPIISFVSGSFWQAESSARGWRRAFGDVGTALAESSLNEEEQEMLRSDERHQKNI